MKIIALMMAVLMASVSMAAAPPAPFPIVVKTNPSAAIAVKITNLGTSETVYGETDLNGEFLYDWSNTELGWRSTDSFLIEALFDSSADRWVFSRVMTYVELDSSAIVTFNIAGFEPTPDPTPEATPTPTPTPTPEPRYCIVNEALDYEEMYENLEYPCAVTVTGPPKPDDNTAVAILATAIASLGLSYYALRIRKKNDGTIAKDHMHVGIRGYHDIDTVHSFKAIRHPRGCFDPVYEKDSSGKWKFTRCNSGLHKW